MMHIRPLQLPDDEPALLALDTSFTTDRIYRVEARQLGFELVEEQLDAPLTKSFPLDEPFIWDRALVAEEAGQIVGFMALDFASWNRRAVIEHLYVAPGQRRRGLGGQLLAEAERAARAAGMRCLWLETNNLNHPGVQFYQRLGFSLCGLDLSLYDPAGPAGDEVALYFVRPLAG